jgi:hypothetical protein
MSNKKNIRIVRGESRFAGAQNKDISLQPFLTAEQRAMIEGDRNLVLNLRDQFDFEREYSTTYRPYGKIDILYSNQITGVTNDSRVLEYMYFTPDYIGCPDPAIASPGLGYWTGPPCVGLPPSDLFTFMPPYRYGITTASQFSSLDSYQDNWVAYISYISGCDTGQTMSFSMGDGTDGINFNSGDGIPARIQVVTTDGKETIRITTASPHGISSGEFVELQSSVSINSFGGANLVPTVPITSDINNVSNTVNQNIFKVDFLGNEFANSESYVLNIYTKGIDPAAVPTNSFCVIKRIINLDNINETRSTYCTHIHKLITNSSDYTLDRTGFENGIYNKKGRVYKSRRTPDGYGDKTAIIEDFKSFLWNINLDIDVEEFSDNLNRPLTELYLTIFQTNRNLMWHYEAPANSPTGYGWEWNFRHNGFIDPFVDNNTNPTNLFQNNTNGLDPLPLSGTTYRGAFVEYNAFELKERVISEIKHSLKFNRDAMYEFAGYPNTSIPSQYVKSIYNYQPHHRIPIRKLSTTISYEDSLFTTPPYATYSLSEGTFRWRPILPIDFFEDGDNGVSYPFLNDAHYPYLNTEFKIEPVMFGYSSSSINVVSEFVDVCE